MKVAYPNRLPISRFGYRRHVVKKCDENEIKLGLITKTVAFNHRRKRYFVATNDGQNLKLHFPLNKRLFAPLIPGVYVHYYEKQGRAIFEKFSPKAVQGDVEKNTTCSGQTKIFQVVSRIEVTRDIKERIQDAKRFTIRHAEIGNIEISGRQMKSSIERCYDFRRRIDELRVGSTIVALATYSRDWGSSRYSWQFRGVKTVLRERRND